VIKSLATIVDRSNAVYASRSLCCFSLVSRDSLANSLAFSGTHHTPSDVIAGPPPLFREQIRRGRALTDRPFGVNLILNFPVEEHVAVCLDQRVPVLSFSWIDPMWAATSSR
jgi:hypothetical protein